MNANRMTLHSFIKAQKHNAALAEELRALSMDDSACSASDFSHQFQLLEFRHVASAFALDAEAFERQLAA